MRIPWEENPAIQKAQVVIILSLLGALLVLSGILGLIAGEWGLFFVLVLVCAALAVAGVIIAVVFAGVMKVLVRFSPPRPDADSGEDKQDAGPPAAADPARRGGTEPKR